MAGVTLPDVILPLLLIIGVVVVGGGTAWLFINQRHQRREGWVECALRSPDRPLHGIGAKWRHGSARAHLGVLTFRPGGPGGARFPRGVPLEIPVLGARELPGQRPALRQAWSINPALHIAALEATDGELEIAADPEALTRLVSRLSPAPLTSPAPTVPLEGPPQFRCSNCRAPLGAEDRCEACGADLPQ